RCELCDEFFFFFQAEDGIRDGHVTGVQTCALPIYFGLYVPGALQKMLEGKMGPLGPTTQGVLLGTSLIMAIPSVMIFLSLVLKRSEERRVGKECSSVWGRCGCKERRKDVCEDGYSC